MLLEEAQKLFRERLTGRVPPRQLRHDMNGAYQNLHSMMQRTLEYGESNSALIVGAKGCGKSTLVNKVVDDLTSTSNAKSMIVRLCGYLQTDDRCVHVLLVTPFCVENCALFKLIIVSARYYKTQLFLSHLLLKSCLSGPHAKISYEYLYADLRTL